MKDIEEGKRLHSGECVEMYERKPISHIQQLLPLMSRKGGESLAGFASRDTMLLPLLAPIVRHCWEPSRLRGLSLRQFGHSLIDGQPSRWRLRGLTGKLMPANDAIALADTLRATNPRQAVPLSVGVKTFKKGNSWHSLCSTLLTLEQNRLPAEAIA